MFQDSFTQLRRAPTNDYSNNWWLGQELPGSSRPNDWRGIWGNYYRQLFLSFIIVGEKKWENRFKKMWGWRSFLLFKKEMITCLYVYKNNWEEWERLIMHKKQLLQDRPWVDKGGTYSSARGRVWIHTHWRWGWVHRTTDLGRWEHKEVLLGCFSFLRNIESKIVSWEWV